MAHVISDNNGNSTFHTSLPFMDPLTHSVIKETSKSLRYYIDVKRRENAFVLNSGSSSYDSIPLKSRYIYGTTKEYPPLYASVHSDNDVKVYLRSFQHQQREPLSTTDSPEKQMCREELNYHMRTQKYSPRENQKFGDLHLRSSTRSNSSCSRITNRDGRKRTSKSAYKISRREQDQLIDNTADLLASIIKNRQSLYQTHYLSQQMPPIYDSRHANPSPRQTDDQPHLQRLSTSSNDLKLLTEIEQPQPQRQKRTSDQILEKAASIMQNAKESKNGLLCDYKVIITTGNCNGASTNASIRIKFYGTTGCTKFHDLVNSQTHRVPFLKNQTDIFIVQTDHVGQLVGITIGHDEKDIRAGWFLSRVSIDDSLHKITYEIPCNAWLSSKSNDQKTIRDFQVTSMISQMKSSISDEHRRELNSQLGSHSTSPDTTTTRSSTTNRSQNDRLTSAKQTKKPSKQQQRVSIGPTTIAKKSTSLTSITNHLSQPPPTTTLESHFNPNEFASSTVSTRRTLSPKISSSDTEGENTIVNQNRSPTSIASPTYDQLRKKSTSENSTTPTNDHRPPARLEKRQSPLAKSPERTIKNKEETNDNEAFSFFD